jgi:hypothetical protein
MWLQISFKFLFVLSNNKHLHNCAAFCPRQHPENFIRDIFLFRISCRNSQNTGHALSQLFYFHLFFCTFQRPKALHDKVSLSKEYQTHSRTDCNEIRPQTAQFYNERISTDLNLVTWQSTVHEPPGDGLKNGTETCRGKFLSVLIWIFVLFKVYIVCACVGILKK